jgi:cysteine desulfurase
MRLYLDHNATTPVRAEVLETCTRVLRDCFGNPSSTHSDGAGARRELDRARDEVAALIGASPAEILFTGGATESNHLALHGVAGVAGRPVAHGPDLHVVSSTAEHPSVLEPLVALQRIGVRVTHVGVDSDGLLDPAAITDALQPGTALLSILWANNETGVVQPLRELANLARARGVLVHVDATQALGKLPVRVDELPIDLLSASAHKLNGPKGTGFLFVRRGVALEPWLRGGPQERKRRGGTENVAGIAGLGTACALARDELAERAQTTARLRDRLWDGLHAKVAGVARNGSAEHVLPNTLNVSFDAVRGDVLQAALDLEGVSVSTGAACASGSTVASHVLLAMGLPAERARAALRFSVGHGVDEAQIDHVLTLLPDLVARVRAEALG